MAASITSNRDYTIIIDKSGSMNCRDHGETRIRWKIAAESAYAVACAVMGLDPDGITVYLFSSSFTRYENSSPEQVERLFKRNSPGGGTNLSAVLQDSLDHYFADREANQVAGKTGETILVITDGVPNSKSEVERVIVEAARKVKTNDELAIAFFQVGKDSSASRYLERLDDDLERKYGIPDIVDAKSMSEIEEIGLEQALLDAIKD